MKPSSRWYRSDTPESRARRALDILKEEKDQIERAGKEVNSILMNPRTFEELKERTGSHLVDLFDDQKPDDAIGVFDGVPVYSDEGMDEGRAKLLFDDKDDSEKGD